MEQNCWEKEKAGLNKFKKTITACFVLAITIICIAILSCGKYKVKELSLDKSRATMRVGETDKLYVLIQPHDNLPDLLWKSSDESVATVESGVVTGKKAGNVIISVSVKDQADITAECEYIVGGPSLHIETQETPEDSVQTIVMKTTSSTVAKALDNTIPIQTKKPVTKTPVKSSASGSKNLGYATFWGSWPNDINGRMEFHSTHIIDSKDPKGRMASPGDYVIGEWSEGHLVQGVWYDSDKHVKGSILIGK